MIIMMMMKKKMAKKGSAAGEERERGGGAREILFAELASPRRHSLCDSRKKACYSIEDMDVAIPERTQFYHLPLKQSINITAYML